MSLSASEGLQDKDILPGGAVRSQSTERYRSVLYKKTAAFWCFSCGGPYYLW